MLPSGRSLGHSLLLLVPLVLVVAVAVRDRDPEWATALAIGALSHTVIDVLPAVIHGEFAYTTSLVWPLLPPPPYDEQRRTIIGHFLSLEPTSLLLFETVLTVIVFIVWQRQDRPGITTIRDVVASKFV